MAWLTQPQMERKNNVGGLSKRSGSSGIIRSEYSANIRSMILSKSLIYHHVREASLELGQHLDGFYL